MGNVFVGGQAIPLDIIDSIVQAGLVGCGRKDTILIVAALGFKIRRLGLSVFDIDAAMR
jgi:hypothetical protein